LVEISFFLSCTDFGERLSERLLYLYPTVTWCFATEQGLCSSFFFGEQCVLDFRSTQSLAIQRSSRYEIWLLIERLIFATGCPDVYVLNTDYDRILLRWCL